MTKDTIASINSFLPDTDPIHCLPAPYAVWEEIANDLPKLLLNERFRAVIQAMPALSIEHLRTTAEFERAMVLLSYIGQAYVWGASQPINRLPAALAVPWYAVANQLGRPPILSYASYALYNWWRFDQQKSAEIGNIALLQNFLGGVDEEWFVLIHVDIEAKAGAALTAVNAGISAAKQNDLPTLTTIPSLDAALNIQHKDDPLKIYLQEMRDYMPLRHRQYIQYLEQNSSMRTCVIANKNNTELKNCYNECVNLIGRFRQRHLEYAASYIFKQSQTSMANPTATGTGGTPFMVYLKKHKDESLDFLV